MTSRFLLILSNITLPLVLVLLFSTTALLFFAGYAQVRAQARDGMPFCERYARAAVEQQAANTARGCGFQGARWSDDYQGHHAWCQVVDPKVAEEEHRARATALQQSCQTAATDRAGGFQMVPFEQVWKPTEATAGNPPLMADAGALQHAPTFVRWTRMETNACRNTLKIWVDPVYRNNRISIHPILNDTDGGPFFAHQDLAQVELRPLSPEDSRPTGPEQVKLTFQMDMPNDDKGPLPASNPPYYVNLTRYRAPVIESITPNAVYSGTTTLITIKGRNLATAGQASTATFQQSGWSEHLVSVTPMRIQLRLTVPSTAVPGSYTLVVEKPCVTSPLLSNFTVLIPSPPAPPPVPAAPAEKEVTVWLKQQPAPPAGGNVPYVGSILPVSGGVLRSITNGNNYPGKQWGVRIVKAGYTTNDCNNATAVVDLPPGKTTTDFQGTALGSGMPLAACIYPVSVAVPPPASLALRVRYQR